jgi:hypothetical protein
MPSLRLEGLHATSSVAGCSVAVCRTSATRVAKRLPASVGLGLGCLIMTDEQPDLKPRIAEWQRRLANSPGDGGFQPGGLLANCLARVLDPSEVIFSDWAATEGSDFDLTSGSLLALILGFAVKAEWVNVPTSQNAFHQPAQHSVDIAFYPLTEQPIVRLHITNVYPQSSSTSIGAVSLEGVGWSQAMPFKARYQQSTTDYFQEVWSAVATARAATNPSGVVDPPSAN